MLIDGLWREIARMFYLTLANIGRGGIDLLIRCLLRDIGRKSCLSFGHAGVKRFAYSWTSVKNSK